MSTEMFEQAIASTRAILVGVSKEQLGDSTPCADWKISDVINHVVMRTLDQFGIHLDAASRWDGTMATGGVHGTVDQRRIKEETEEQR